MPHHLPQPVEKDGQEYTQSDSFRNHSLSPFQPDDFAFQLPDHAVYRPLFVKGSLCVEICKLITKSGMNFSLR
jgi:hypothetical protein